ncbi:rhamnogalacturonan acetylesterase [Metabacillus arenae]|uniref:Rhamnogalacturonan acetylesterase n=1 Tax=Metabacillus arenae TaxID=2771434 RepID=A0A926NJU4_9BACI|nr:rhamnogalacturonan acetylesterase [Metabacillus arenae]MBD1379407.1 rhamnogalacturonan acetylesterase [Metabacillus arenae]
MNHLTRPTIFIAGDSTASTYPENRAPQAGWGQVLNHFFTDDIKIVNEAASGRSSKSFIKEERLNMIAKKIKEKDYLFIQFGHNDAKKDERYTEPFTDFKYYLNQFIDVALNIGAIPLLITPVQRRSFDLNGNFEETHGDYPEAVIQVGKERNVSVIDLAERSKRYFEKLGYKESKKIFLWLDQGNHSNYPDGVQDNTHFCLDGAIEISRLIVEGIRELHFPIEKYIYD